MVNSACDRQAHTLQRRALVLIAHSELHPKFRGISGWITGWRVNWYVIKQGIQNINGEM